MLTVTAVAELRHTVAGWRRAGERIAFVPTMGALHEGHLSLVRLAHTHAERVVASIFVNPAQFAPHEDLDRYPRPLERDRQQLAAEGCDLLFLPGVEVIYPPGFATHVEPAGAAEGLETDYRPHFFRGVATVVTKLFHLVAPDVAVFGQKDAQQLAVVRQLVRDLDFPLTIVAGPTAREADGLAMSSRNVYLEAADRQAATVVYRALQRAADLVLGGERRAYRLRAAMAEVLAAEPRVTGTDYTEVVDASSFRPLENLAGTVVLAVAARLGATRLIDNLVLRVDAGGKPHAEILPTS
jgi:pantoate--beta-alanine ligase